MRYFIISAVVYLTIALVEVDAEDRHVIRGTVQIQDNNDEVNLSIKRVIKGYEGDNIVKRLRRVMKQKKYSNKQPGIRGGQKKMKKKGHPPGMNKKRGDNGKKQNAPQSLKQQYMVALEASQQQQGQTNNQNPYRTCLDRFTNRQSGFSYDTITHTNLQPFTARNERLISDTIYLSLLQDSTPINTNSLEQLEEYTLNYLADNIGGRGFEPACVQIMDRSYDTTKVRNNSKGLRNSKNVFEYDGTDDVDSIESNTLKLQVTYVEKLGPMNRSVGLCSPIDKALCCSQKVINNANRKTVGQYCSSKECNVDNCGSGRRQKRGNVFNTQKLKSKNPERSLQRQKVSPSFTLKEKDYTISLGYSTTFQPEEAWVELGVDDIDNVAKCSTNRYSIETYRTPTLRCGEFVRHQCSQNDDMMPKVTERNGGCTAQGEIVGYSTAFYYESLNPTLSPTLSPTLQPTISPSFSPTFEPTTPFPSLSPSLSPTLSPTTDPTLSPTRYPTIDPTLSPTLSPTESPTNFPTVTPTEFPTVFPTDSPSLEPTKQPTRNPTQHPSREPTYKPTVTPTTLAPSEPPTCIIIDFNVCYALDKSGSTAPFYQEIKDFGVNMTESLQADADSNSVTFLSSIVEWGDPDVNVINPGSPLDISPVTIASFNSLPVPPPDLGGTDASLGITACNSTLPTNNPNEKDVILVITDGRTSNTGAVDTIVNDVKNEGTLIIPVFIGSVGSAPLWENWSSTGEVYYTSSDGLNSIVDEIELC